jgi:hypothetical protein
MKALYWAPVHGQTGTTSNLLVTALIAGLYFNKKGLITQTHFNYNNLESPFLEANSDNNKYRKFFREIGIDALARNFKVEKLTKEWLDYCCTEITNSNMKLLPGTTQTVRESFDYEMDMVMIPLLKAIETYNDHIFIDISSGSNPLSMKLMGEADIVVVNLSQNMNVINLFFENYKDMLPDKVFYIIGNYDYRSKYNLNNIRKKYHKYINSKNSDVIPYNTGFHDAQMDGRVADFIQNNLHSKKKDPNFYFIHKAISSTEKLLRLAGVGVEKEMSNGV